MAYDMQTAQNQILTNSQFNAIINGNPTGLAGCSQSGECLRASACMRSDERLPYRAALSQCVADCTQFIGWAAQ